MKKVACYRKIPIMVFLVLLVFIPLQNQAQSVKRQCISSYSSVDGSDYAPFVQTVGQPYNTSASHENMASILPGFQQPVVFKVENICSAPLKSLKLKAYPNPAAYSVEIQCEEPVENSVIRVMDCNGKVILTDYPAQLMTYNIDCAGWPKGIYFITVSEKNLLRSSLKLIINK